MGLNVNKKNYMLYFVLSCFGMFLYTFDNAMTGSVKDSLKVSYKDGFINKGFVGSVYHGLNKFLPFDFYEETNMVMVNLVITLFVFALMVYFVKKTINTMDKTLLSGVGYFSIAFGMLIVGTLSSKRYLGSGQLYMIGITLLCLCGIMFWKKPWICLPLSVIGVFVDPNYTFLFFPIVCIALLYEYVQCKNKGSLFCAIFFALVQLCCFSLCFFKGENVLNTNRDERIVNLVELPIYLILVLPYLVVAKNLLKEVFQVVPKKEKRNYWIMLFGGFLALPCFITQNQFGCFIFALLVYYGCLFLFLLVKKDPAVLKGFEKFLEGTKGKQIYLVLLAATVLYVPYWDRHISAVVNRMSDFLNGEYLHLW